TIEKVRQVDPRKNLDTEFRYIDVSGVSNEFFKIIDSKGYTGKNAPHRARKPVREHDIIFATVRPYLKRAAIVPEDFSGQICSTAFTVVRCLQGIVDHKFVFYYLLTDRVIDLLTEIQRGSNYPAVSDNDLYNLKIPLPPLPEQRKIAEILSAVDEAIQKTEEIIQKTQELKKGFMQQLLTRGIGHIEFKQTEIGEIPEEWEVVRLGEITEIIGGGTPSTGDSHYWNGNIPFVIPTDITNLRNNYLERSENYITEEGLKNSSAKLLPVGTVLLTSRATIGFCAIN
ncbi:unnamed protein product, partial [marine sediment metagenome]